MNKIKLLLMFMLLSSNIVAQKEISFDTDCPINNSILLAKVLYETIDKNTLESFFKKKEKFTIVCTLNSSGQFMEIKRIRNQQSLSKEIFDKVEKKMLLDNTHFYICYMPPEHQNIKDDIKKYIDEKGCTNAVIAFPGNIKVLYNLENMDNENPPSIYDFIKTLIKKSEEGKEYIHTSE